MSRRFGRNQRRRFREEVAKAQRQTGYWIERADDAERRSRALQDRLRRAIELEVKADFQPMDRTYICGVTATYREQTIRAGVRGDSLHLQLAKPEARPALVRTISELLWEKLQQEGWRG